MNIKLRDINGLTSNQTAKMWDRCRSQENQPAITHHLQSAEKIIHQTHYHRRLPELKQLLNTKL